MNKNKEDLQVEHEQFWSEKAQTLSWRKPFTSIKNVSFDKDDLYIRWFEDGQLNVSENCVDRHLEKHKDKTAIIWQGNNKDDVKHISYQKLYEETCKLANALTALGVEAGDRVILYMPMVPEAAYAMLACARIGAIHSAVFGGFSAKALADRIQDCEAKVVITAAYAARGAKQLALKTTVDEAIASLDKSSVEHVITVDLAKAETAKTAIDLDYRDLVEQHNTTHDCVGFDAETPLFILYTSGSTGKPKGLQHSSGGYLCYAETTFRAAFDYQESDVFWCSADIGWITGHSYLIYGPLSAGATTLMFEGTPNYPDLGRCAEVIDQHQVTIFYTAPTIIRMFMTNKSEALNGGSRSSLRVLGTVGEPINPDVWRWYKDAYGHGKSPVVDTWWQTETGGHMILPLPGTNAKPGCAGQPFDTIQAALVDSEGNLLDGEAEGNLVMLDSWPGQGRTIWRNHQRFIDTYFSTYPNKYFCGDGARRDADGDYWITGRVDDVLNVSGHRLGTAEIESAAITHDRVVEAAVVSYPHDIKGEAIYIYVVTEAGTEINEALDTELRQCIRKELGPVASPEKIQWTSGLPKTRSGKIMRRILRKIAREELEDLGDTSTLADPAVVDELIQGRSNI